MMTWARGPLRMVLLTLTAAAAGAQSRPPVPCDITSANLAIEAGWTAWRGGDTRGAEQRFRAGVRACPTAASGWTGLGYVALRNGRVPLAIVRFDSARAVAASPSADAAIGLGIATFRAGDRTRARAAFLEAAALAPNDSLVRDYLARLPKPITVADLPARTRPDSLRLAARTGRRIFEVPDGRGGWRPLWVKAINLGAALPGRHPSEFPPDDGTYEQWIRDLAEVGANAVRVYTVHPPHFYRALREWNLAHPASPLWLIHGVWTELPPGAKEENYDDPVWHAAFLTEMQQVVDVVHGHAAIAERPGHASGLYTADLSSWTLGYILGREWEPFSVEAFAKRHPQRTAFAGRYITVQGGNAVDVWLATVADSMIAYEMARWNAQRPLAYTNWPTLDPLTHPTESSRAEEAAWHARRGEKVPEASLEYDNDIIALDARVMQASPAYRAGLFASFHAYPYYPDFMVLDPQYARAQGPEGPSHFAGYLQALIAHHGDQPVVISEVGVPSSRGNAHRQPQGWDHGGHDEVAQGAINARLTREIAASGAAGIGIFAMIDEWFKKNWMVIDFEEPLERNRLWFNALDPEQNYGLIAMRAGVRDSALTIDGAREDWHTRAPLYARAPTAPAIADALRLDALYVHHDEAYLYLRLDVGAIDWNSARYVIGIDSYDARRGDTQLPFGGARSPVGLEFVLDLNGPASTRLLVDRPYTLYRFAPIHGSSPAVTQAIYNRPFQSRANRDGLYDTLIVTPNRRTIGRDGTVFDAQRYERNLLRHARQQESTLADWYADPVTRTIEVRIPWGLLHVMDPSSRHVLHGMTAARMPAGITTSGFRFIVQSLPVRGGTEGDRLPRAATGFSMPPVWSWPTWETPRWHAERKPAFGAMRETFNAIPESGPQPR